MSHCQPLINNNTCGLTYKKYLALETSKFYPTEIFVMFQKRVG